MADEVWQAAADLGPHLSRDAREYAFYQAVSLIQKQFDGGKEPGSHLLPSSERLFFRVDHRLNFPISDVAEVKLLSQDEDGVVFEDPLPSLAQAETSAIGVPLFELKVTFLGLHGVNSPLPAYYQETIATYDAEGSLLVDFFDFFHHRLVGLLYRSMRKYRYDLVYKPKATDSYSKNIFSIFGLADDNLREQSQINWARLLCFAGLLSTRNRSAVVIATVIKRALLFRPEDCDVEIEVNEWIPRYVDIPMGQRTSLNQTNSMLGMNAVLGDRVYDLCTKFQVFIKNLNFRRFRDFLPLGSDYQPLRNLIELMLRDQFAYDIKLGLSTQEAEPIVLGQESETAWVGWTTFLGNEDTVKSQVNDVIISARL